VFVVLPRRSRTHGVYAFVTLCSRFDDVGSMIKEEAQDDDTALAPAAVNPVSVPNTATKTLDQSVTFLSLCRTLEEVCQTVDKGARIKLLENLWRGLAGTDYFPFMRLIVPQLDTQRSTYGLRESKIARYYIDLLGLSPSSADAERFRHWKDPSKNPVDATHFSDVVYVVLCKRAYVSSASLTVAEVNHHLNQLALLPSVDDKKATLMTLLRSTSALEQKWLIRVLTKEMKMGIQHGSILAAFHPSALELYNNTNDLQYVCHKCTDPSELRVAGDIKSGIFLMQPLKPMLASVVDSSKLSVLLRDERLFVEPKYDGERMMIHVNADKIMYWTRNARNYTASYGPKFNHVLRKQLVNVSNVILDGEFLLYDGVAKKFKEFGQNRTHAATGLGNIDNDDAQNDSQWFCYCVFDVVFLNGESLTALPLTKRKEVLRSIIDVVPTKVEVVPHTVASTTKSILLSLDDSLRRGFEGIVIKIAGSHYIPGERKLKWLKLKPDHIAGMADTLDLIILGGYFGVKFGQRHISHFLLGVWDDNPGSSPTDNSATFTTVCKVGTGYNEADLREINDRLESRWLSLPTVPKWLKGWVPAKDDLPDQWIHPRDSVVMEVFGYSFNETVKFSIGYTIRFPRCHRMRYDKDLSDATTLSQAKQIIAHSGSFAKKFETMEELVMVRRHRQDARKNEKRPRELLPPRSFASAPASIVSVDPLTVEQTSSIFSGYEFCVLFAAADVVTRPQLERMIIGAGGRIAANPTPLTSILVATGAENAKVRNWIQEATSNEAALLQKYSTVDIVRHSWVQACLEASQVLPFTPDSMIFVSEGLRRKFAAALDGFSDPYYEDATLESLQRSIGIATRALQVKVPSTDELRTLRAQLENS
jgi:DNA ligase-4